MPLANQISNLTQRIGNEVKALRTLINGNVADLSALTTTAKNTLVAAINEVKATADAAAGGGASINDSSTSSSTAWSSQKISDEIVASRDALVNGAGAAYDTLQELAAEIQSNDTDLAAILTAQAKRVAVDQVQSFTQLEKDQGIGNLGAIAAADIGDPDTDFVAIFETALT